MENLLLFAKIKTPKTPKSLWISVVILSIACGVARSESDGLVPAIVVRGEDSPNASAIAIIPPAAKVNSQLPDLSKPASAGKDVRKLPSAKKAPPKTESSFGLSRLSSLRASEFEFAPYSPSSPASATASNSASNSASQTAWPAAIGPGYPESVDGSTSSTAAFHNAIESDTVGIHAGRSESKVQQTQFLKTNAVASPVAKLDRTKRLESPLATSARPESSRAIVGTSGHAEGFVPMAVSVGDPSIATPEAYMAAPANDPVMMAAKSSTSLGKGTVADRTRLAATGAVPASRRPATSMNPFQLQEARPRFAVSPPKKPAVARPSGLQSATLAIGKKPARTSLMPKISIPKVGIKKPSWLPNSLRR